MPDVRQRFGAQHFRRNLQPSEEVRVWKLMELQRNAMLMYTSCGWFFDDVSGIETVQVIQYAGRVLQLAQDTVGLSLEEGFLSRLEAAQSNVPERGNGRQIYERAVRPTMLSLDTVGAH